MGKEKLFLWFVLLAFLPAAAQERKTKNIVLITFDGYRWNELFNGADSALLFDGRFNTQDSSWRIRRHWSSEKTERKRKLMPFFWSEIARKGQLYGNRQEGNKVDVTNRYWFSYPGYNELLTGYPDSAINSNAYPPNPHVTILEFLNRQEGLKGKVASFASWDTFRKILNAERAGFPINAGFQRIAEEEPSEVQQVLNELQYWLPKEYGSGQRQDAMTYVLAREYVKKHQPRVLHLGFIETDALAHSGKYDFYLDAANYNDQMIGDLWTYMQSIPFYKDQTTFIITTDHGRGRGTNWQHHFSTVPHSNEIFLAVIGPDTPPEGEMKTNNHLYQQQIAQTMAALMGFKFENGLPVGEKISTIFFNP